MSLQRKRNIFGILLIALLVIPTLTTVSWLNYQKKQVKKEVKHKIMAGLSSDELIELNFELHDVVHLKWKRKHEFEYKGKMYDIVYHKTEGLQLTYYCWLDKEETALNAKLDNLLQVALSGNKNRRSKEYQLDHFLKSLTFQSTVYQFEINSSNLNGKTHYIKHIDEITINIPSPPPELS